MSRISSYNMELEEELHDQLNELGFDSLQDALNAGYVVTEYVTGGIPAPVLWKVPTMTDREETNRAYEQAKKDWEREKEVILGDLMNLMTHKVFDFDIIERAYKFIKEARF